MKTLYLLDFDGTITKRDTLFHFLRFCSSPQKFYFGFILFSPLFLLTRINFLKKAEVKEKFISYFLKGKSENKINEIANLYASNIGQICRPKAIQLLNEINNNPNNHCYIVSASLDLWLKPIAKKINVNLICTNAFVINGKYSGKFKSKNCNFEEKKTRILEEIDVSSYKKIISYGDSEGDLQMFSISNETYYKPFR